MINFSSMISTRFVACVALTSAFVSVGLTAARAQTPVAAGAAPAAQEPAPTKEKAKYLRYLRVGSSGTQSRNLGDANGVGLGRLAPGTLVAVYEERGDWLECEVPGGFEIWVYGKYVSASAEAGMLEINGSDVRARPMPSSGPESYPLQPNLARGDRVRLIARNDSTKPLAEDWVKVYSPPGVRAYVSKAECEALTLGMDGAAAWANAVLEANKRGSVGVLPVSIAIPAAAPGAALGAAPVTGDLSPQEAMEELSRADAALTRERGAAKPDLTGVRAQYERVFNSAKEGATKDMAKRGLAEVDALIEAHAIRAALSAERERFEQETLKRQVALAEAAKDKDIFSGRFDSRGWVEKRTVPGMEPTFLLRWGGDQTAEIICNSGRYDMATFLGYEVGISGRELRSYTPGDIGRVAVPRLIDAARIEVISGRQGR